MKSLIEGDIVRKGDLTKEHKKIYKELFSDQSSWKRYNELNGNRKRRLLRPVLAFMLNLFFEAWNDLLRAECPQSKYLHSFIKWYFDQGLVPDRVQMAILRRTPYYGSNYKRFDYLDIHKRRLKDIIDIDTDALFTWATSTGDRQIVMRCIKHKPVLFNNLQRQHHGELVRQNEKTTFNKDFIQKAKRMAILQPSASKQGLWVDINKKMFTPVFNKRYVSIAGKNLRDIPNEMKTPEICRIALELSGSALEYVPPEMMTPELCALALKRSSTALRHIPADKQKSALVLQALLKNNSARRYIKKKKEV